MSEKKRPGKLVEEEMLELKERVYGSDGVECVDEWMNERKNQ